MLPMDMLGRSLKKGQTVIYMKVNGTQIEYAFARIKKVYDGGHIRLKLLTDPWDMKSKECNVYNTSRILIWTNVADETVETILGEERGNRFDLFDWGDEDAS